MSSLMPPGSCAVVEWVCSGKPLLTQMSQSGSWCCWVVIRGSVIGAASCPDVSISGLRLTINLEGKHEHTLAFKGCFVSSHLFQMQNIYLVFFFGPWGEEESLS